MENLQRKNEILRDSKTANTVSVFLKIKCIWGIYYWELQPFLVSEKMLGQIIKQSICKHQEDNKIVRNCLEIYQDQIMSNKSNFFFALDN